MRAIDWVDGQCVFLDQTLLPHEERFVATDDVAVIAEAIRALRIRGAPAIGVAAGFGVAAEAARAAADPDASDPRRIHDAIALLAATRPTAVNLFHALARMRMVLEREEHGDPHTRAARLLAEARAIQDEDIRACERIGRNGSALLGENATLMTHCNAGALATAGIGTALGVILTAARQGKVVRVFVDETRPLLQGARLTAWELHRAGVPVVLITDNAAGSVMRERGIDAVFVGADRIAANGDTANKIGTYPLAVLARHHGVPFYVAAPLSTIDRTLTDGQAIPIEERDPAEVTRCGGTIVAPDGIGVYAPAFDVTPNELITGIVTEVAVLGPPFTASIARVFPPV